MKVVVFILISIFLISCKQEERLNVPLAMGFKLDRSMDKQFRKLEFESLKNSGFQELTFDLELSLDSLNLPNLTDSLLKEFQSMYLLSKNYNFSINLIFSITNPENYFDNKNADVNIWFQKYTFEINKILKNKYFFNRIFIYNHFSHYEKYVDEWKILSDSLRNSLNTKINFIGLSNEMENFKLWNLSDEIAIHYESDIYGNPKKHAIKNHPLFSKIPKKFNKPIYIVAANLIHGKMLIDFKNRLRFWDPDVTISGLNINTVYEKSCWSFDGKYFNCSSDPDLKPYIIDYLKK